MNIVISSNDISAVLDKVRQYNEENLLSDNDFLKPEEIIENEEIRNFGQLCKELNDDSVGTFIYHTFI
ncbi:MAG: hypothetical protein LBF89_00270 [Bacteroidales bacterium]|jgi:hypothetical protein|nr:hypothetical protein [Bacteroidales bacterium]